jgi:hypothetical protein
MKHLLVIILGITLASCTTNDKYDVASFYEAPAQDSILTSVITYIYTAPPYVLMKDRFKGEYRKYYTSLVTKFSINKFYVAEDGTHFYYVIRPGIKVGDKRGVGGYFKMNKNFQLSDFHEIFVTPVMPEEEIKTKGAFLFDKMVKGEVKEYLKMKSYVQWPNPASEYDTTKHEWVLKLDMDSTRNDGNSN